MRGILRLWLGLPSGKNVGRGEWFLILIDPIQLTRNSGLGSVDIQVVRKRTWEGEWDSWEFVVVWLIRVRTRLRSFLITVVGTLVQWSSVLGFVGAVYCSYSRALCLKVRSATVFSLVSV